MYAESSTAASAIERCLATDYGARGFRVFIWNLDKGIANRFNQSDASFESHIGFIAEVRLDATYIDSEKLAGALY